MAAPLLSVEDLRTWFVTPRGVGRAVDGVELTLERQQTLAVVGESGCGKTMLALSILRLVPRPGRIVGGRVVYQGTDLLGLSEADMRAMRGNAISMIFQEPMTSLNPVFRVGEQIAEAIRLHQAKDRNTALAMAVELLRQVGIPVPEQRVRSYPHELSGGMRQRVMIAMALACDPEVLLADEPTTALDVTIQAEILALMADLKSRRGASVLLITHDLAIVAETADRVVIMYAGKVVENAAVLDLFDAPQHPYTQLLLAAVPRVGRRAGELAAIRGTVPSLYALPSGCHFHPRCPRVFDRCRREAPPLFVAHDHGVRCWLFAPEGV